MLERAASLLPPEDPARTALLTRLGAALFEAGRFADADQVLDEATDLARRFDERSLESRSRVERQFVRLHREPSSKAVEDARCAADGALQVFEEHADDFGQSWPKENAVRRWWKRIRRKVSPVGPNSFHRAQATHQGACAGEPGARVSGSRSKDSSSTPIVDGGDTTERIL